MQVLLKIVAELMMFVSHRCVLEQHLHQKFNYMVCTPIILHFMIILRIIFFLKITQDFLRIQISRLACVFATIVNFENCLFV